MIEEQIKLALNELEDFGILSNVILNIIADESYVETIQDDRSSEILDCFAWIDAPEGRSYWSGMYDRIQRRPKIHTFDVTPKELRTTLLSMFSKSQYPEYYL